MTAPYDVSAVADYWPGVDPPTKQGAPDMDAAQAASLHNLETMVSAMHFGIVDGKPVPFAQRGEITARLRSIDRNTVEPLDVAAIATAVASHLPTGQVISQVQIEAALKTVLGSLA